MFFRVIDKRSFQVCCTTGQSYTSQVISKIGAQNEFSVDFNRVMNQFQPKSLYKSCAGRCLHTEEQDTIYFEYLAYF